MQTVLAILQSWYASLIASLTAPDQYFEPATLFVGLVTAGPEGEQPYTSANFTFPTLTNFPRKGVASWTDADIQPDGSVQITSEVLDFSFASGYAPTTFTGAIVTDSALSTEVKAYAQFDTPIPIVNISGHARFVARLTFNTDQTVVFDLLRIDG